ncbi:MAG: archaellin/type IV pilin N-terminal domain-containing protein [Candidatus Heimdallarchaeota archaeon]
MNLNKALGKKRAVSPVVAAILLIGLTVAAGAIVYFIVLPMLSGDTTADDIEITWNENGTSTVLKMYVKNEGSSDVEISAVTTNSSQTATFSPAKIKSGTTETISVTLSAPWGTLADGEGCELTFDFTDFSVAFTITATDWDRP